MFVCVFWLRITKPIRIRVRLYELDWARTNYLCDKRQLWLKQCPTDENICIDLRKHYHSYYYIIFSTLILVNWTDTTEVGWNI